MIDLRPSIKRQSSTRAVGAKAVRLGLLSVVLIGLAAALLWSAPSARAAGGLPSAPEIHTSTPLHQGLRVYWWPPSSYGESAVTGYDVHDRASRATTWTDADHDSLDQPAVITGLAFNTTYEVRVRALNANGAGPWSSVERTRTSPNNGRPDAPWPPVITAGDGQLSLSWRAPAYTGARNRPIAGYRVLYTTDDGATWRSWAPGGNSLITGTSTTITGLENGVLVGVVVAAVNSRGQSRYSGHTPEAEAVPAPALTLSLESSRKLCTANTLTELNWTISGGVPPYALTIEGGKVDPKAESHLVNCGPIPTEPLTGDPLPEPKKRFTAVVTDARSIPTAVSQQIEVKLAAPLPAPSGAYMVPEATMFSVHWDWHRRSFDDGAVTIEPWYAVRWRQAESAAWTYSHVEAPRGVTQAGIAFIWDISDGEMYEAQIAELRHPIEIETSVALIWTDTLTTTTFTSPSGLSATATHDMITVQWNRQTHVDTYRVSLIAPKGRVDVIPTIDTDTTDSHQITIGHLHPDTTYIVRVVNLQGQGELGTVDHNTETSIRTQPAPTGWTPLPRGPQNLRATATHDSIRVDWEHPFEHTDGRYHSYRVALWHPESPYPRLDYAEPNATSFVFTKLQPGVTYRAVIKGGGLVRTDREISVTTPQTPSPASQPPRNQGRRGILGEVPIPGWPLLKPDFAWPLEFGLERRMTTDIWVWREIASRYHAGLDIGGPVTGTERVLASAAGRANQRSRFQRSARRMNT